MAKILTFRNKGNAPSGQDFLTDEAQTLSFRTNEDGAISLGDIAPTGLGGLFPDPKKDWSNQELADLFRVRQLLSAANVPVETDRGITDEGDPWFVFCHANGEVFIHLCRIDGLYVLDSPNVLRPLRGADFNGLIADFTNQALPAQGRAEDSERRVIRLERGGKVRLHPSAMLAALIWTLFLASEELVLLAPEDKDTDSDALLDFDGMFAVETSPETAVDLFFGEDGLNWTQIAKDNGLDGDHILQDSPTQMREAQHHQQGLTAQNNAFSLGLSTIAIAMGFMSETVLLDNQRKVLESIKELGFSEYGADTQQTVELDIAPEGDGNALLAMLADFLGLDLSFDKTVAEAATDGVDKSLLGQDAHLLPEDVLVNKLSTAAIKAAMATNNKADLEHEAEGVEDTPHPEHLDIIVLENKAEDTLQSEVTLDRIYASLSDMIAAWQTSLQSQDIARDLIDVSFEASDNVNTPTYFDLVNSETGELIASFHQNDKFALQLVEFIEGKVAGFGVATIGNSVYMIDRSAADGGQTDFIQWESADGKMISLIGLASDFEQFDMIA